VPGFARLSGWQPVGNWVASAGEFSSIPVTRRRYPDNEQKNRDAQFAPKNAQKPKPSRWPATLSSAHRKGQKPSPAAGSFFLIIHWGTGRVRLSRRPCPHDFDAAYGRLGSFASDRHAPDALGMSALGPIASEIRHDSEMTRGAMADIRQIIRSPRRLARADCSGTVRPIALAVFKLIISSNLVGC
jgi:hypothetical protein